MSLAEKELEEIAKKLKPQSATPTPPPQPVDHEPKPEQTHMTWKPFAGWILSSLELGVIIGLITWFWR